jgi:hypothetical protein
VLECLALDGVGERAMDGQKDPLALEVLTGGVLTEAKILLQYLGIWESSLLFRRADGEVSRHQKLCAFAGKVEPDQHSQNLRLPIISDMVQGQGCTFSGSHGIQDSDD